MAPFRTEKCDKRYVVLELHVVPLRGEIVSNHAQKAEHLGTSQQFYF